MRLLLLEHYRRSGKQKPQVLIWYRDGVSEGQFPECSRVEVCMATMVSSQARSSHAWIVSGKGLKGWMALGKGLGGPVPRVLPRRGTSPEAAGAAVCEITCPS